MVLGTKIASLAVGSVIVTVCAGLLIQRSVIRQQGIELLRDSMRATMLSAEHARGSVSAMRESGMFAEGKLKADARGTSDYRKSKLYKTVPVVAAWESIRDVAQKEGFEFRVPALNPRNSANSPQAEEQAVLHRMEAGEIEEYFAVDDKTNEVLYARAIILTKDCLACHGDPSDSPTQDGKDMLGFRMEGWRSGGRHGMFLLRAKLDRVDATSRAGLAQTALWLIPLSILIGGMAYLLISRISNKLRALTQSLTSGSTEVNLAVEQIGRASQTLAQGASEQTASLEETSASSEEITGLTRRNADVSRLAGQEMEEVQRVVRDGNAALGELVSSMTAIRGSSDKISRIIKVIDEIAFQTNILALNAAVEAARAGESGAGFAVVADEVRALAQRSAQAAKDTAPLIEESIANANEGNEKLNNVANVIRGITERANKVKNLMDDVSTGSQEQARGIEQVSKAMVQMTLVTQANAASAEESAAATQQLAAQADGMNDIARQLQTMVDG